MNRYHSVFAHIIAQTSYLLPFCISEGVVVNKIDPEKYEQTRQYLTKAIEHHIGKNVPILGWIPDRPYLGCPALADVESQFATTLLSGSDYRYRHYDVGSNVQGRTLGMAMVTTDLAAFLRTMKRQPEGNRTIYVCHATRDDIILGFMAEYQRNRREEERPFEASLLVCGRKGKYQMADEVRDMFEGLEGAPVMVVEFSTHQAMHMIHDFTPKLNIDDKNRVRKAVEHYEPYIDFELLLERTKGDV